MSLEDSRPKEMFVCMPVINCKAGPMLEAHVNITNY